MTENLTIAAQLIDAMNGVYYGHLSLSLVQQVKYHINLVNHLGEIVQTTEDPREEEEVILSSNDGDIMFLSKPYEARKFFESLREKVAQRLFDLSLTHRIVEVTYGNCGRGESIINIWIEESPDHQTNIDATVVEMVLKIVEKKRLYWRCLMDDAITGAKK